MKHYSTILWVSVICFTISCGGNKLKTDEKTLAKQILTEEEQLAKEEADRAIKEKQLADSIAKLPKGFRFKPERRIDPQNAPVVIDIAGNIDKTKKIKLSDVASSIQYIRLQPPSDSAFIGKLNNDIYSKDNEGLLKEELPFSIIKNNNFIIAENRLGMLLYDSKGQLLRVICKNVYTGTNLYKGGMLKVSGSTFKGANGFTRLIGNKLYYNYNDDANRISQIMKFDCSNLPLSSPGNSEIKNPMNGLGIPVAPTGNFSYSTFLLDGATYYKTGHPLFHKDMLAIFNNKGDTLCSFQGTQNLENYIKKSVGRRADYGARYLLKGDSYFREANSDTIFKVVTPNRLIPTLVINLGKYKVEKFQQQMDPEFDLSNKFLPQSISFNDKYVFVYYTKGYDSPYARGTKTVSFYHAIFDRAKKELWHVAADQKDQCEYNFGLENDLDGGMPVWPYSFSEDGAIVKSIKGIDLKEYIKTEAFINSTAPAQKKEYLKQLANSVGNYETVVVIIK
jgi:hypothetical protein